MHCTAEFTIKKAKREKIRLMFGLNLVSMISCFANSFHSEIHQVIDHTHIFWMGDLNYRIDLPYPQG